MLSTTLAALFLLVLVTATFVRYLSISPTHSHIILSFICMCVTYKYIIKY